MNLVRVFLGVLLFSYGLWNLVKFLVLLLCHAYRKTAITVSEASVWSALIAIACGVTLVVAA